MSKRKPRGIISMEDTKPVLDPLVPTLLESFWEAWEWTEGLIGKDPSANVILHSASIAGMVSDAFGYYCRPKLQKGFGAIWSSNGRFQQAVVGQAIALRFKKLTPDLHSMNVRTEAQRKVYQQENELPGSRKITGVTMGYTLTKVGRTVTGIYFACPCDFERNAWVWPIYGNNGGQLGLFTGTPRPPSEPVEDVLDVNIKLPKRKRENG